MKIYQTLALGALAFEGKIETMQQKWMQQKGMQQKKDATKYHEIETRTY